MVREMTLWAKGETQDNIRGQWEIEDMGPFARELHDPWAWGYATSTSMHIIGGSVDTEGPGSHVDRNDVGN